MAVFPDEAAAERAAAEARHRGARDVAIDDPNDFGDVSVIGRIIIAVFAGLVGGGTIGFLAGGFLGARRRANLDLAEERGVVVGIGGGNAAAADALQSNGATGRVSLFQLLSIWARWRRPLKST